MAGGRVDVIDSRGCSKLFVGIPTSNPSLCSLRSTEALMLPVSSALVEPGVPVATGPFAGLVICVTGLSKEARKQVMDATERLGGQYSSSLHPQCTHLVVQSFGGRKFEHALKHGLRNGLLIVTLGWFVDSVRRNVRLNESLYIVKSIGENELPMGELNQIVELPNTRSSCLPTTFEDNKPCITTWQPNVHSSGKEFRSRESLLSNNCIYIDSNISNELKKKVVEAALREGATILDHWFIGCHATHVVCEGPSIQKYIGHTNNLVTPLWVLKTAKENNLQRLVHLSSDLARQVATILENAQISSSGKNANVESMIQISLDSWKFLTNGKHKENLEERQKTINLAKVGVRSRRCRRMQLQSCQTPIYPITPSILLDSICWSISEPTSTACVYMDSSSTEDATQQHTTVFFDAREDGRDPEAFFENFTRPLRESEKRKVIFKNHFLTILFPIDRFGELGPSSRTFFGDSGFTCLQVLDHIYDFYQECMSANEIELAIHTDSRHADSLRSLYANKESLEQGFVSLKRIEFLGSRRSFESLKRVSGENNRNVYELLIRS